MLRQTFGHFVRVKQERSINKDWSTCLTWKLDLCHFIHVNIIISVNNAIVAIFFVFFCIGYNSKVLRTHW